MIGDTGTRAHHKNGYIIWNIYEELIMDIELPEDFKEFLNILNNREAEYQYRRSS